MTKIPKVIKEDYDDNVLEEPVVGVELPDLFLQLLHHPLQLHHLPLFNSVADHGGVLDDEDGGAGDNGGDREKVKTKALLCSLFPLSSFLLSQHLSRLFQLEKTVRMNLIRV